MVVRKGNGQWPQWANDGSRQARRSPRGERGGADKPDPSRGYRGALLQRPRGNLEADLADHLQDQHLDDSDDQSYDQPTWRDEAESAADRDHNRFEIPGPRNAILASEATDVYLTNFLARHRLTKNTEGIVRCTIEASNDHDISKAIPKILRIYMVNQLYLELSRGTWTAVLREYCNDVAKTGNESLKDSIGRALLNAVHRDKEWWRSLVDSDYFEKLSTDRRCAPVLISLLVDLVYRTH
ncbi:MAG: hypothetical protein Q9215_003433 [Flavoplaca cf. flavocitrina]